MRLWACAAETLWYRGYPDQALERVRHALSLAQALSHPFSLAEALGHVAFVHLFRREGQEAQAQAEALLTLAHEHGFALWLGFGTSLQGWALVERAALVGCTGAERSRTRAAPGGTGGFAGHGGRAVCPTISGRVGPGLWRKAARRKKD